MLSSCQLYSVSVFVVCSMLLSRLALPALPALMTFFSFSLSIVFMGDWGRQDLLVVSLTVDIPNITHHQQGPGLPFQHLSHGNNSNSFRSGVPIFNFQLKLKFSSATFFLLKSDLGGCTSKS